MTFAVMLPVAPSNPAESCCHKESTMSIVSDSTRLDDLVFVAFDTETTGLSATSAHLLELSGVKFSNCGQVLDTFSQLIDPQASIPPALTAIHGITDEMVSGQPTYKEVIPDFFNWVGAGPIVMVAHNAPFDLAFLQTAVNRCNLSIPRYPVIDTLPLSRRFIPEAPNHKLGTLTTHLKLEAGGFHRALADSHHVRNLLVKLLAYMPEVDTWGDMSTVHKLRLLWVPLQPVPA